MKNYILTILILLASFQLFSQDTLSSNTSLEKAKYLTDKMVRELNVDNNQKEQVFSLLYARSNEIENFKNLNHEEFVEKLDGINSTTIEKLKEVLNPDQFTVFLNLRKDKLKAEEKFKNKNPDYVFTKEDEELDF
jgi:hypothetical protein